MNGGYPPFLFAPIVQWIKNNTLRTWRSAVRVRLGVKENGPTAETENE